MNILFITFNGIENAPFGGAKASIRNYKSLSRYSNVIVYTISKKSNAASGLSLLQGNFPPILNKDIEEIKDIIKKRNIDFIFYDSSIMGDIQKRVKFKNVVFCHNCEREYTDVRFGAKFNIKKEIYKKYIIRSETEAIKNANFVFTLTKRDSDKFSHYYHRAADQIIPLSIEDSFKPIYIDSYKNTNKCLLFGPAENANIESFTWFIKNVSPRLSCKTLVAGKGMEILKEFESDKVEVIGYVDSLSELYANVDCVVIPLLFGGGMKVKTAEALMFGKYIFGTEEALIGYDTLYANKDCAKLCTTADEFVNQINQYMSVKHFSYNKESRDEFLMHYSAEATDHLFNDFIKSLQ